MLFFSNQAPVNATSSSQFKARGNSTDVPTQASDVQISIAPPAHTFGLYQQFKTHLITVGLARYLQRELNPEPYNRLSKVEVPRNFFPHLPVVGVVFPNNLSERAEESAERYGLTREVINKRTFYRGSIDEDGATQLLTEGAEVDPYLPYGVTTIGGLFTFYTLRKILYIIIRAFPRTMNDAHLKPIIKGDLDQPEISFLKEDYYRSHWVQASRLVTDKTDGHCCPYFPGMSLPDKNYLPNLLANLDLTRLLGESHIEVSNSMVALRKGWKSLCYTEPGMAMTHAFQSISYAINSGMSPVLLAGPGNTYFGSVLFGEVTILKGSVPIQPKPYTELRQEVRGLDTHTRGIAMLVEVFNSLEDDATVRYEPAMLTSPRRIHSIIIKYKYAAKDRAKVFEGLNLLDFPQTFWNARNVDQLVRAINMIAEKSVPGVDDPIAYRTDVMFSTNPIQQVLSLFGERVPCFSMTNGNTPLALLKPEEAEGRKGRKNPTLERAGVHALPVFLTNLPQATAAWDSIINHGVLHIRHKSGKPEGAFASFPATSPNAMRIVSALYRGFKARPEKKRRRDAEEEEVDEEAVRRAMKKLKGKGVTNAQFFALLGREVPGAEEAMDEE